MESVPEVGKRRCICREPNTLSEICVIIVGPSSTDPSEPVTGIGQEKHRIRDGIRTTVNDDEEGSLHIARRTRDTRFGAVRN